MQYDQDDYSNEALFSRGYFRVTVDNITRCVGRIVIVESLVKGKRYEGYCRYFGNTVGCGIHIFGVIRKISYESDPKYICYTKYNLLDFL
jgi:hypothetical protein